jgi:hypothetical protein
MLNTCGSCIFVIVFLLKVLLFSMPGHFFSILLV